MFEVKLHGSHKLCDGLTSLHSKGPHVGRHVLNGRVADSFKIKYVTQEALHLLLLSRHRQRRREKKQSLEEIHSYRKFQEA